MDRLQKGDKTAREIYDETLGDGSGIDKKGVQIYKRPYLWRDDTPTTAKDTFTENFIPTPTLNTNETPRWRRVLCGVGLILIVAIIVIWYITGVTSGVR